MTVFGVSGDLEWWRTKGRAEDTTPEARLEVLERLKAWKAQHDADRALQANPFRKAAWDGVFGDEDERVTEAIRELEATLGDPTW